MEPLNTTKTIDRIAEKGSDLTKETYSRLKSKLNDSSVTSICPFFEKKILNFVKISSGLEFIDLEHALNQVDAENLYVIALAGSDKFEKTIEHRINRLLFGWLSGPSMDSLVGFEWSKMGKDSSHQVGCGFVLFIMWRLLYMREMKEAFDSGDLV